jgi:hypothetical protein
MQTEILNAKGPAVATNDTETINLIFEGAKRELKFRQAAIISHLITTDGDKCYLESKVDIFARGRAFVLTTFSLFLLVVFFAIYQSTDNWADRVQQLQSIAVWFAIIIPLGFIYLNIEKRIRHHRLHQKIEKKLVEFTFIKSGS